MTMLIAEQDGVVVAMPGKQLDTNTSPEAEQLLMESIENGMHKIIIDFSKTSYVSSAGLRVIIMTAKKLKEKNGYFALCQGNEQIIEVLEISGLLTIISHFASVNEAINSFPD